MVIVPCGITASLSKEDADALIKSCQDVEKRLKQAGIRVFGDYRDNYAPGWKFSDWELKGKQIVFIKKKNNRNLFFPGVPIRVEFGPNDKARSQLTVVLRHTGAKSTIALDNCEESLRELLEQTHKELYTK